METTLTTSTDLALWVIFPEFLSDDWIASQKPTILSIVRRVYDNACRKGGDEVIVSRDGRAFILLGIQTDLIQPIEDALIRRGMTVFQCKTR